MLFGEMTQERFDELVVGRNGYGVCLGAHRNAEPVGLSRPGRSISGARSSLTRSGFSLHRSPPSSSRTASKCSRDLHGPANRAAVRRRIEIARSDDYTTPRGTPAKCHVPSS